ncbi:uncharacterized protein BCR38DRAFT_31939 [Pseudomassariella vexata]|uniref:Uncharacterized protein n=1 Tax=Pseudomassariella vexata TaxID=1141098 RepID=A0A1Y2DQ71_9PEZI|nr:uncharacterized protein BCR38DRAFT_31939 [Pseudomassariella vexata]ORY61329.1 hypothetical protein BCR38DRAFT_31939 [Pseudomassariella vexata]
MQPGLYSAAVSPQSVVILTSSAFITLCHSAPATPKRNNNPLGIDWDPAPAPEDGPPGAAGALRDPAYLPAQIGGIVGSYALSLVIVATLLLILAKKRREHIEAGELDLNEYVYDYECGFESGFEPNEHFPYPLALPKSPIKNFSHPTPIEAPTPVDNEDLNPYIYPSSPQSAVALGINPLVDQNVVAADREMAQQQLEEMYKYVMEQEEAKQAGVILEEPPAPILKQADHSVSSLQRPPEVAQRSGGILRKGRNKPAGLDLAKPEQPEKTQSRTSTFFSALKSPRKKPVKGISISSPIMTPMSGTFPRYEGEEMETIPPRHYAPAPPPPVPADQDPYARRTTRNLAPITPPDFSPESTMSIDERLEAQLGQRSHSRNPSQAPTEPDPASAISEKSTTPLVGLPSSPKPGVTRFPTLPSSPKPGASFSRNTPPLSPGLPTPKPGSTFTRANAPSAVRTGGALPLRAYEPSLASPSMQTTKQTTFERADRAPLSPGGLRTPWTGAPVPYSPYQPYTPVVPITPSLVTRQDRKRMRQLQPKTPTLEMVKSSDDIW